MRIAHVTATFPPYLAGTGNVAYHNARLLHERGHEVTVLTAKTPRDFELSFSFAVERLPAVFRVGNAPLTPSLVGKLRNFDLIHLHYPFIFGAELALLASRRYRTPLVLTYHNQLQEQHPLKRGLFKLYNHTSEPVMMRGATKVLAVREEHLTSLHPRFRGQARLAELPNGVDLSLFKPQPKEEARKALGLPLQTPLALFVGALDQAHRFKNVDGLIRAFARLSSLGAYLLVVGDGGLRPSLETLASGLGLSSCVRFLGRRPPQSLPPLYSAADVVVLPSTGVESFGLVLIEAMACATPVIASDLPGVRTLIEDGVDGRRVAPGDTCALAEALRELLTDPRRAKCMGLKGREKVESLYDWNVIGNRLEGLYKEVLAA